MQGAATPGVKAPLHYPPAYPSCIPPLHITPAYPFCCLLQLVLSSVHAVKGLECVVCFVVGLDTKAWRYLPYATGGSDLQQASLTFPC